PLMSTTYAGVSTSSFIRSTRVVPPARKRTRVSGQPGAAARRTASSISAARRYWKACMASPVAAHVLHGVDDVGVRAATAQVAAHQFAHLVVAVAAGLIQERGRRHDLPGGAVAALVAVVRHEGGLQRVRRPDIAQAFEDRKSTRLNSSHVKIS